MSQPTHPPVRPSHSRGGHRFAMCLAVALMGSPWSAVMIGNVMGAEPVVPKPARPSIQPEELLRSPTPLLIGHRGAAAVAPENTLPAFAAAIEAGADLVEFDYYHDADGRPFVFHDKYLDRTTDSIKKLGQTKIEVDGINPAKLRDLDAGTWFDARFAGTKIPSVEQALTAIRPGAVPLIERKGGDAPTLVRLLAELKMTNGVVVQAFDWAFLRDCAKAEPKVILGALGSGPLAGQLRDDLARLLTEVPEVRAVGWKAADLDGGDDFVAARTEGRRLGLDGERPCRCETSDRPRCDGNHYGRTRDAEIDRGSSSFLSANDN